MPAPRGKPQTGGHRAPGFTLIELLTVIALMALLVGLVTGAGRYAAQSGRTARAKAELAALASALETYRRQHGDYPRTVDGAVLLQALIGRRGPTNRPIEGRAFLDLDKFTTTDGRDPFNDPAAALLDPWGERYRYAYQTVSPWTHTGFVLYSAGPDGADEPTLLAGGLPDVSAAANRDNIHALR